MTIPAPGTTGELSLTSNGASVVLDTNVVLDWLLFDDPSMTGLAEAVERRRVRWLATPAMREELSSVLERGLAAKQGIQGIALLERWDRFASIVPAATVQGLRCTDPDDQKFIDLALGAGARWLVSRDRALLNLARHVAPTGTLIVTPKGWQLA